MDAFILDTVRTPRSRTKKGTLAELSPVELLLPLFDALRTRHDLDTREVSDVLLGCVTQTGAQGADIAKIAALYAGWDERVSGATINRFCASGLSAVADASARVMANVESLVVAGGIESLSKSPMFSDGGAWFTDPAVRARTRFLHMAVAADLYATLEGVEREALDAYALRSHQRAAEARDNGHFAPSLISVTNAAGATCDRDEAIRDDTTLDGLAALPAAYASLGEDGSDAFALTRYPSIAKIEHRHTVGTSPAFTDAASLVLVGDRGAADRIGARPRAKIRATINHATEPVLMLDGNIEGTRRALAKAGLEIADIDLFEVNESFAVVPVVFERTFGVDPEKLNVNGGALAMGHPLGATGGILLATALDELERRDEALALVSIVGGAGVTATVVLERV